MKTDFENTENEALNKTDVMRCFFISEYEKFLENKGIDTVCFMGYGYDFEDVKVGAEFYMSYLYFGKMSSIRNATKEEVLRAMLLGNTKGYDLSDKYKIIQKYRYFDCKIIDHSNRLVVQAKERRVFCKIKNIRTKQVTVLKDDEIDDFYLFLFDTW